MKRRGLLIGVGLLAALAGNGALLWRRTRAVHPRFAYQGRPTTKAALAPLATDGFELVTTTGKRGELTGLFAPPARETAPLLVHFPGNGAAVLAEAKDQLRTLIAGTDAGALCFAPSGFDASAGDASLSTLVEDVVAVLTYVRTTHPQHRLCLTAFSLGALPALVARTLLESTVPTLLFAPFTVIEVGHVGPLGRVWNAEVYDTRPFVREPGGPLVIVHGSADPFFPPAMGQELAALASPPAELVIVDGVAHMDLPLHPTARATLARVLAAPAGAPE